jgi:hypothetical protein
MCLRNNKNILLYIFKKKLSPNVLDHRRHVDTDRQTGTDVTNVPIRRRNGRLVSDENADIFEALTKLRAGRQRAS